MARSVFALFFGLAGVAVLIWLGTWQMQRLAWKEAILADIEQRVAADPVDLPERPDPVADKYLSVTVTGGLTGPELHVLVSTKEDGAVYRVIQAFDMQGRRILVDQGIIPLGAKDAVRAQTNETFTGNLHWPQETDGYTPEPDAKRGIWFARDVEKMARELGTEAVMVVVRRASYSGRDLTPLPVDTASIPNDHLLYAITWFSLAVVWLAMTGYFLWREAKPKKGKQP